MVSFVNDQWKTQMLAAHYLEMFPDVDEAQFPVPHRYGLQKNHQTQQKENQEKYYVAQDLYYVQAVEAKNPLIARGQQELQDPSIYWDLQVLQSPQNPEI